MKHILLALLLILFAPSAPAQEAAPRDGAVTLEAAVSHALESNHSIRIARNNAEAAANNTALGTAGFLPTLDASGTWSLARSEQETNSPFSFGDSDTRSAAAQLSLNWTLFDGFRMFVDRQRYRELAVLGAVQARSVIEQTVVTVVRSYVLAVQQAMLLDVLERTMTVSRTRYLKEGVRRDLGGSAANYLNARIAYHSDSSAVLEQRLQLRIALQNLNLAMGRAPGVPLDVERRIDLPEIGVSLEEALRRASGRNAAVTVARQNLEVAAAAVSLAQSALYPRINLFATYGVGDRLTSSDNTERFSGDISTLSTDATVGLSFSFNLFNGFRNSTETQNAELAARSASIALEEARFRMEALIREQFRTLETRLDAVAIAELNLEATRSNLDLQLERFETGAVTSLEFRDAQILLVRAETALINARFQARIGLLELQRLTGDLRI